MRTEVINGETHFCCSLCNKNYKQRYNVYRHVKIEHAGRKFACPYCTYTSGWKEHIKHHVQRKHKDKL